MNNFSRLIKLLWSYPAHAAGGLLAIVIADVISLSVPWITKSIIDQLQTQTMTRSGLLVWGCVLLLMAGLSFLSKQVWRHLILGSARRTEFELRRQLLDKTLSLTLKQAQSIETGKFLALASNDIPAVGQALAFGVVAFFDTVFITAVAFALMYRLSPALTGYSFAPFPILGLLMIVSLRLIYKRYDECQDRLEKLTEKTRESVSGIRTLRSYAQEQGDIDTFEPINRDYLKASLDYARIDATFSPLILLFAGSSSGILLYFGGQLVIQGDITVGTLAAFVGYLGLLTWPMIACGWMLVLLQRGTASLARLNEVLDTQSEPIDQPKLAQASRLSVRNLNFAYPDGTQALIDWNLEIRPGQTIGIVGPVGSGKSTFLRLLQRLVDPPESSIFLDASDIATHDPNSVRSNFSYVSQEPFLFSDTIANNLRMACPQATDDELVRYLEFAGMTGDLQAFPNGMDTVLGEKGVSLSGGQKQRTALARALLKKAPFLLLDDTLSAVDTVTEAQILNHLRQEPVLQNQTTIIVSHRISAVALADEILVVEQGRIVDRGHHFDLSTRSGIYRELLSHQSLPQGERFV